MFATGDTRCCAIQTLAPVTTPVVDICIWVGVCGGVGIGGVYDLIGIICGEAKGF